MDEKLGRVMTVTGSHVTINAEADLGDEGSSRIGAMVKMRTADREIVATISTVRCERTGPRRNRSGAGSSSTDP
jgi:hypothetical protein